jgi:tripartite-type tricarboxylate transporter receptor subunit TctC
VASFLRALISVGLAGLSVVSQAAPADLDPSRPVHLVVPFPPGGSADQVARIIALQLADELRQPVVVDNRPGADGAVAAEYVAHATPDGHTLFMATYGAMSAVPGLHKRTGYDPVTDFTPITTTGKFAFFLFTHPTLPGRTPKEVIDFIRAHPGQVNYGTGNAGSIVATAELASMAGLTMTHVPYRGEVPAMADFLSGRVQLMVATPTNMLNWVREGKLRAIATMMDKRSDLLPDVPTFAEAGLPALPVDPWAGVFGPANMPHAITTRLSSLINVILSRQAVRAEFMRQGFEPKGSSPDQLANYVRSQLKAWAGAIDLAGLKAE